MNRIALLHLSALLAVFALLLSTATNASAGSAMPTKGATKQPLGHYEFCRRYAAECGPNRSAIQAIRLSASTRALLERVNLAVNASIEPRTDEELWGVPELWSYAEGAGDCEDYVLVKQRALEAAGVPRSTLLITVVRQSDGSGHAVLTVRTDKGDLVLDNLDDEILPWEITRYSYIKRQSQTDSKRWVAIEDDRDVLVGSVR